MAVAVDSTLKGITNLVKKTKPPLSRSNVIERSHKRITKADRLTELKAFIRLCIGILEGCEMSLEQIAKRAGLSESTIIRLGSGEHTLAVRFGTVQALGYAAGMRLELTEFKAEVTLVA